MRPRPLLYVVAVLLLVQASFSSLHVVGRLVLDELSPFALAGTRVLLAAPLLALWAWRHDRRGVPRCEWPELLRLGLLGIFANQLLFLLGLSLTSATTAALWMPTIPILTAAAATVLGLERLTARRRLGVLGAGFGAFLLVKPVGAALGPGSVLGNLALFLNCLSYSFFLVLQRPVLARLPWRTTLAGAFVGGSLFTLLVTGPNLLGTPWTQLRLSTWIGIFWIGLVPTVGAFALNAWAVAQRGPTLSAAFTTLQPVLTALSASVFLGERLDPAQVIGGSVILISLGLCLANGRGNLAQTSL